MIDVTTYQEKLEIAQKQKSNPSYSNLITIELRKLDWQQRVFEIEKDYSTIRDEQDFHKYQKNLIKLFNDIYEVITAPGVDEFIGWVNEITAEKNNTNAKKLRDFLVERYSEYTISESIEIINSNKQILDSENSIFTTLLNEVKKEFKRETSNLLNDPKQFENIIEEYLQSITETLIGLMQIKELNYTSHIEFYSEVQKTINIEFYENFVKTIIDKGQSLKLQNDPEKEKLIRKVQTRLTEIKKSISILVSSEIASNQDELLKSIFLKLDNEIKYEKGISIAIQQFIGESWQEIKNNYIKTKEFFQESHTIHYLSSWDTFAKKGGIISLIDEYNLLSKDNILLNLLNKSTEDIIKLLKSKAKSLDKYYEKEQVLKEEIKIEFIGIVNEFKAPSKKQLLNNLSLKNEELANIKFEIEKNIEGLNGGISKLNEKSILAFLKEDFSYVMNNINDIRSGFETFLQKSNLENHLAWLETKCNGSAKGEVTSQDLSNPTLIIDLLEKGLIKIEIAKTF